MEMTPSQFGPDQFTPLFKRKRNSGPYFKHKGWTRMMLNAYRLVRSCPQPFLPPRCSSSSASHGGAISLKLQQAKGQSAQAEPGDKMAQKQPPPEKTGDVMSDSFGEGYATRSDDDGFGGIYGGNQSLPSEECERKGIVVHENHPNYDKSQGSEVKEKEMGRNLPHGAATK